VPIDARSEMPDLSTRAAEHADQALRLFDHLAGTTTGEEQFEAAWRCGRSLALLGRYDDALDAFAFAHHTLRGMHPSDTPPHLKPLADGLNEDRKRVAYLRDVTRYGLEYLLYRRAQEHRLAGRYEQAAAGYRQVIDTAQDTMTRLLIEKLSTAPGFTTPADDNATKVDESPYTAASRLYEALCMIELGKAREAVKQLETFADEDPATKLPSTPALSTAKGGITPEAAPEGNPEAAPEINPDTAAPTPPLLFRGQALLELGRIALEHELDLDRAETYFARLDHWITLARADNADWAFSELLPGIKKAAKARTDGPDREYRKPDFWGNVKKAPIDPGMLVNRKTTPWYLDDLEEDTAKFRGFLHFARGDGDKALEQWKRIIALDDEASDGSLASNPNDFTRLKFGAERGYLIAYPQDLKLYTPQQRTKLLLADFHYVSQDYEKAEAIYRSMLSSGARGAKAGLPGADTAADDYLLFALAECAYRARRDKMEALQLYRRILATRHGTWTEARAAFRFMNRSREVADPQMRKDGEQVLAELAESNHPSPFAWQAKVVLAFTLMREDRFAEADELLAAMPPEADARYVKRAAYIRGQLRDPGSGLWRFLDRPMPQGLAQKLEPLS